jgi:hypothetical protein
MGQPHSSKNCVANIRVSERNTVNAGDAVGSERDCCVNVRPFVARAENCEQYAYDGYSRSPNQNLIAPLSHFVPRDKNNLDRSKAKRRSSAA